MRAEVGVLERRLMKWVTSYLPFRKATLRDTILIVDDLPVDGRLRQSVTSKEQATQSNVEASTKPLDLKEAEALLDELQA